MSRRRNPADAWSARAPRRIAARRRRLTRYGAVATVRDVDDPPILDLRGVACPLAWAKAKVHLETLARGAEVVVLIDDPRSLRDLPRAAEASGHHVVAVDEHGPPWRIRLEV